MVFFKELFLLQDIDCVGIHFTLKVLRVRTNYVSNRPDLNEESNSISNWTWQVQESALASASSLQFFLHFSFQILQTLLRSFIIVYINDFFSNFIDYLQFCNALLKPFNFPRIKILNGKNSSFQKIFRWNAC